MQLFQLIYKSKKQPSFPVENLSKFTETIRKRNKARGITGVLLFDGQYFLQVLEGTDKSLTQLISEIETDKRHDEITIILKEPIMQREHPNWGMRLITTSGSLLNPLTEEIISISNHLKRKRHRTDSKSSKIIQAFSKGLWTQNDHQGVDKQCNNLLGGLVKPPQNVLSEKHQFAFQPIYDAHLDSICCVEGLLRGPNGESPISMFANLPTSERYQLDVESKYSALNIFVCQKFDGYLSLNLLPGTLIEHPKLVTKLIAYCKQINLDPKKLIIEITEQEAFENINDFIFIVNHIRAAGIQIAIDDFGSGYAGLSLLSQLQPHKLKIDRAIIGDVHHSGPQQVILEAIFHIANRLGIEVIVEGVEKEEEFKWLLNLGIRYFQGYYFAKPIFGGFSIDNSN